MVESGYSDVIMHKDEERKHGYINRLKKIRTGPTGQNLVKMPPVFYILLVFLEYSNHKESIKKMAEENHHYLPFIFKKNIEALCIEYILLKNLFFIS